MKRLTLLLNISALLTIHFHSNGMHTHVGEVRLADLCDSVVAGVEVSGVFGQRWNTVQLQVVTVDRTTEAYAQQANRQFWKTSRGKRDRRIETEFKYK